MGPRFHFGDYHRSLVNDYTEKQEAILNGEIPLEQLRMNELAVLVEKATARGDEEQVEIASDLYWAKKNPSTYKPTFTQEEAKQVLQNLTPWKIKWSTEESQSSSVKS